MKLKPLYIYGIIFVVIIIAIIITSNNSGENIKVAEMPNDAVHQGMGEMPNDAMHSGIPGGENNAPSKNNVKYARLGKRLLV